MGQPTLLGNLLYNVTLARLGRREEAACHPVAACFLVTRRCELACGHCLERERHRGEPELDTAGALAVLAGLRGCCDLVDISGGDPALRPDLEDLLGGAREYGFSEVALNSPGLRLLDRPNVLRQAHSVMLEVQSLRPEPFAAMTGGTAAQHRDQLEALVELHRMQREYAFDLQVTTVVRAGYLEEVDAILAWCFDRDLMVSVSPELGEDLRVAPALRRDPAFARLTERLVDLRRRGLPLLGSVSYYEGLRSLAAYRCAPLANLTVGPGGELYWPCGEKQNPGPSFAEGRPLRDMVAAARERYGPLPDCGDRCHFACRLGVSALINHPLEIPAEGRHLRRYKRFGA